jgi:ATP-dependent Clp protease protease subunit
MSDTPTTPNLRSTVVSPDAERDITQAIENHDVFAAVGKLHTASHAMNDQQFHELLVHLTNQNATDRQERSDLPVLHLTKANGVEGLQIDDGKNSITFCEGERNHRLPTTGPKDDGEEPDSSPPPAERGKEGVFYFYDEVSQKSVLDLTQQMESWAGNAKNKDQPIRIVMNSPGGSVFDGFSMMDEVARLRRDGHHVKIEDYGMAASAAGWMMQAADTRAIGANSWLLIHEPSGQASGKLSSMGAQVHLSKELEDQFLGVFAARSHLTTDQIRQHIDDGRDWWIPANTAKTLGLVDVVETVPPFHPEEQPTPQHK